MVANRRGDLTMLIEPIKRYPKPNYPIFQFVQEHPELLEKLPKQWFNNPVLLSAACAAGMLIGCDHGTTSPSTMRSSSVAPVYAHGEGRAIWGGVIFGAAYSFFTEAEARRLILDEFTAAGYSITDTTKAIENVKIPATSYFETLDSVVTYFPTTVSRLQLDGYDSTLSIGYEFVSDDDFYNWRRSDSVLSTVYVENLKTTAERLRQGLMKKQTNTHLGVFYDPLTYYLGYDAADSVVAAQKNKTELQRQVRDFIGWLRSQGAL